MTAVVPIPERRPVTFHLNLAAAERDVRLRGECVILDMHGLWWSVPAEHTVRSTCRAVLTILDELGVPAFTPAGPNDLARGDVVARAELADARKVIE